MKYLKNNFANCLALLALLSLIFKAFIAQSLTINENLITRALTSYTISYLAFKISYMETKKVGLIFLPLIFYSLVTALIVRGGFGLEIPRDMAQIITNLYKILVMIGVFFVIELIFNRIFGSLATSVLGVISLFIFLILNFSKRLVILETFEDFFLYFSFYIMAIRVRSASSLNPFLLVLGLSLVAGEIYLSEKYIKINYGFLLSIYPLSYLALKTVSHESAFKLIDHLIFALIYTYPALFVIIKTGFDIENVAVSIISILASYILGESVYKIKNKYLSYLFLGIN